jgi:hypothetical protein
MYQRKTKDWYNLMIDYGYGDGLEFETAYETKKEANQGRKKYIENVGNTFRLIKIVKKREKIKE